MAVLFVGKDFPHLHFGNCTSITGTSANMNSDDLAKYLEATDGIHKPWLLAQLRLQKLQERREDITPNEYEQELADIHQSLMNLGEWWKGREDEMFGS
ncbi:hypothetical protein [Leptolyngbya ohadii]|uniref:hypothetical protein n=1 Tax=Leptolyngbya ohadii TaxID=1962290 RepID=UPI0027298A86|nr:hypothetical protein [Leptolyngbya ohadii]